MARKEKSNRGLLIALIALLAVLVVCMIVLIVLLLSKKEQPQQSVPMETTVATMESADTAAAETTVSAENTQAASDQAVPAETAASSQKQTEAPADTTSDRSVFREVLQSIHDNHQYMDMEFEPMNPEDTDIGRFAISDFDGDGKEELLVLWDDTFMAAMIGIMYGVDDSGKAFVEYSGFPAFTFYENGIVEQGISHNQGLAGAFWPYSAARYNPGTDVYDTFSFVDAWDKSLAEVDYEGNSYPEDADTSHSGIVYYINDESYEKNGQPVDVTEYEAWHQSILNGASVMNIDMKTISNQEIQAIAS